MGNVQSLEFTRIVPRRNGIFVFATYPRWRHEYKFIIQLDGKVKGKTSNGLWLELSRELGLFVREKVKSILGEETKRIYA